MNAVSPETGARTEQTVQGPLASVSLISLLMTGTAAINLDTIAPPENGERPEEEVFFIGFADDEMKRVYAFHSQTVDELRKLGSEGLELTYELAGQRRFSARWFLDLMSGDQGRREKAERLEQVEIEMRTKEPLAKLADKIFWAEVRRSFTATDEYEALTLYGDWSLGGRKHNNEELDILLAATGPLAEAVERMRRRH